jgi:hypothetical protein
MHLSQQIMGFPMRTLISLLLVSVLTACGGGGGASPSVTHGCISKAYSSAYPDSYVGSNQIPNPTQKLDASVMRSVGVKDYYPTDNNGCSSVEEHTRILYKATLSRLQKIGVEVVEIYQFGPVDDFTATTWTISDSNWQIPKSELAWFVQEAHSRNLKVTLVWQLWPTDNKGNNITGIYNVEDMKMPETVMLKALRGWHDIILQMAKLSNENNIDNLYIQWQAFFFPSVTVYPETATQEFLSIISDIRNVYRGKLFMGYPRFYDKRIIEKVDAIVLPVQADNWSAFDDVNMSVSLLKQRFTSNIVGKYLDYSLYSNMDTKNIPVIWDFNIQSRDKALSQGWVEDGFCIATVGSQPIQWGVPSCMQVNYTTDFSVQAQAIQGAFEAIKEQTYFKTYGVLFSTGYWHTDTLVPGPEGFPNFSQSIRGKPAEGIVKQWFTK